MGMEGSNAAVPAQIRKTIQSIKEIVGEHSDADIYAALKESGMDPNETTQKLLHQDPFHEVKRKRDKKKENAANRSSFSAKESTVEDGQLARTKTQWVRNDHGRVHDRNPVNNGGSGGEFRVVKDKRSQNYAKETKLEEDQQSSSLNELAKSNEFRESIPPDPTEEKHSSAPMSKRYPASHGSGSVTSHGRAEFRGNLPKQHVPRPLSSGPLHYQPYDSRIPGSIGSGHRQFGPSGARRVPYIRYGAHSHDSNSPFPDVNMRRNSHFSGPYGQRNSNAGLNPLHHGRYSIRAIHGNQNGSRYQQAPSIQQKGVQPNKEWKPKPVKESTVNLIAEQTTAPLQQENDESNLLHSASVEQLSETFSQANISGNHHLVIPAHLQVPESEQTGLTFGSFGSGFDGLQAADSTLLETEDSEHLGNSEESSISSVDARSGVDQQTAGDQTRVLQFDHRSVLDEELEEAGPQNNDSIDAHNVGHYHDIQLVQSEDPLQKLQHATDLPGFSAFDLHSSNDPSFFSNGLEGSINFQGPSSAPMALTLPVAGTSAVMMPSQHQQPTQPQALAQLYPQVHFQNFVPYRHVFPPVFVPPVAMPNYASNIPYGHPSSANNFVLPGGSSHLPTGGIKYGATPYKAVPPGSPAGYGSFSHPAGYTVNSSGVIGGMAGLEDLSRIKYKDTLYLPNSQAEASDIWIQTPREMPAFQSPAYYNLSGQAAAANFIPNAGNASFNVTAQSSHAQYPGMFHPQQPGSIMSPHHMVHQPVPSPLSGNVGVGVAAPVTPVGTYQQQQLNHLNWRGSF